jgi:hypothetical protein
LKDGSNSNNAYVLDHEYRLSYREKDKLRNIRCVRNAFKNEGYLVKNNEFLIKLDRKTNLIWLDDARVGKDRTYKEAIEFCENLEIGGYKNWRIPNINELLSITNYSVDQASIAIINGFDFVDKNHRFWFSTKFKEQQKSSPQLFDFMVGNTQYPYKYVKSDSKANTLCVHDNKIVIDGGRFVEKN